MKYKILILTILILLMPKDTQASFVGNSPRPSANCTTGINCGIVGYWTFDGKDVVNGVIKDISGNGNNGNAISIASSTFYTPGRIGQAGNFDGVNDYVDLSSSISLGNTNWTTSVWVKLPSKINQDRYILTNQSGGPVVNALRISSNKMGYYHYNGSWNTETGNITVGDNRWHLLTWVNFSNQTMNMYVDGVLDVSGVPSSVVSTGLVNRIGAWYSITNFIHGILDDLRIYNRALSAQEIQQLYSTGAATKVATSKPVSSTCVSDINCGLVGYWTFDGKDIVNGVIKDVSGSGNNGNPSGIASSTFYTPGKMGQGARFDGVDDYVDVQNSSSLNPTGSISWGGWVNQKSINLVNQSFVNKITAGSLGYMLYNSSGAGSTQRCFAYGLTPNQVLDPLAVSANRWTHYMCTYNGSTLSIYRNGVLAGSSSVTGSITHTTNVLNIGKYGDSGAKFSGAVDDIRVYNRALSAQEVQQLYSMGSATKVGVSSPATSTPVCSTGLSCGLVGYWTFDGKNMINGVVGDASGRGIKGYLSGIASTTFYAPGKIGQGGNFDGVNDKVLLGDNLDLIGSPLTISAWVNPASYSGLSSNSPSIVDKLLTGGNYRLNLGNGLAQFLIRDSGGSAEALSSTANAVLLNKWTHVLVTYDNSTTGKIYINGVLNSTKTNFTLTRGDTSSQLQIGNNDNNANSIFNGKIDDVRIYNRVLSDKEIQQLYSQSR